jgi:hypothetical protein
VSCAKCTNILVLKPKRRELRADVRIMYLREVGLEGVDWIDLAQDRDRWQAFVKAAVNLMVPQKTGCSMA